MAQVTIQIWCACGLQMEISVDKIATCPDNRCADVINLPQTFNQTNNQITAEQVVAIAEQVEIHHLMPWFPEEDKEEQEPLCYVGCNRSCCWSDEPAPSWD